MIGIRIDPVDTWFFRDGTPFTMGSAPQENVGSLFPPHPSTVTGALRAALARCNGWDRGLRWPGELNAVLGDGPDNLGSFEMKGPFLLRDDQPLFPVPRHLLGSTDDDQWIPRLLLRPGCSVTCDLGDAVRLPETPETIEGVEIYKPGDGCWLTLTGLEKVLRGDLPNTDEVVPARYLWSEEPRIGLERDRSKRTAEEGMLYSTQHVRLDRRVSLGVRIAGVPEEWTWPIDQLIPLGGESRLSACKKWRAVPTLRVPLSEIESSGRVTFIALTPLDLDESFCSGRRPLNAPGNVRVVSACLNRPQRIGGWDSLRRRPLSIQSVLPSGSVLFCETTEAGCFLEAIGARDGLAQLGSRPAWGFGVVALGAWSDEMEVNS